MHCSNCGSELGPGVRFCEECGTPVAAQPTAQPTTPSVPPRPVATAAATPAAATVTPRGELKRFNGHTAPVVQVAFAPNGRQIFSAAENGVVHVWDLSSGQAVGRLLLDRRLRAVDFSRDGRRVVGDGSGINVWEMERGSRVVQLDTGGAEATAFLPDGAHVLYPKGNSVIFAEVVGGRVLKRLDGHVDEVMHLAVSADGRRAISGRFDGDPQPDAALVWDLGSGICRRPERATMGLVSCVAISQDGQLALAGTYAAELYLWSAETGVERHFIEKHVGNILSVAFTPSGRHFLSASGSDFHDPDTQKDLGIDNTLRLWSVESGDEVARFEGHAGNINCIAVSADGRHALTGSSDMSVRLWALS